MSKLAALSFAITLAVCPDGHAQARARPARAATVREHPNSFTIEIRGRHSTYPAIARRTYTTIHSELLVDRLDGGRDNEHGPLYAWTLDAAPPLLRMILMFGGALETGSMAQRTGRGSGPKLLIIFANGNRIDSSQPSSVVRPLELSITRLAGSRAIGRIDYAFDTEQRQPCAPPGQECIGMGVDVWQHFRTTIHVEFDVEVPSPAAGVVQVTP